MAQTSYVYCDHAAGSPCRPEAAQVWREYATRFYANPGAHHPMAYEARRLLDESRARAAAVLGVDPREVVFTAGGTESDGLALRGVMKAAGPGRNELVISAIEHHAVLLEAERLRAEGHPVHLCPVSPDGVLDLGALKQLAGPRTALVSVMLANNETGVIQPVREAAEIAHAAGARFHCDAVQAFGKLPCKPRELGADLLSLAGAKFGAPKGTGLLVNAMTSRIAPVVVGGPQEGGLRAGTENLPGIAALARAMELAEAERTQVWPRVQAVRDAMEARLRAALGGSLRINGGAAVRLPNISNLSFAGIEGQALGIELGERGFCVGLGSACAPGETDPSHVLAAMGLSWEDAVSCIRVSFGAEITEAAALRLADLAAACCRSLRGLG